jgi:hypothetical protein
MEIQVSQYAVQSLSFLEDGLIMIRLIAPDSSTAEDIEKLMNMFKPYHIVRQNYVQRPIYIVWILPEAEDWHKINRLKDTSEFLNNFQRNINKRMK